MNAKYEYNSLIVTCDATTVDKVRDLLLAELNLPVASPKDVIQSIVVRVDLPPPTRGMVWLSIVPLAIGASASSIVFVAGLIAISKWLLGH